MFDPDLAEIRFGCGRSPRIAPPRSVDAILGGLTAPDLMAREHPIPAYDAFAVRIAQYLTLDKTRRSLEGTAEARAYRDRMSEINLAARRDQRRWIAVHVARRVETTTPMRERLEAFWADHFTTYGKGGPMVAAPSPYVQSAIRPHLIGRFEDLLISAVTHPMMLQTLDQATSAGPNSRIAKSSGGTRGLNENLAREVLELHTLGVDGPYTQGDVRELAKVLAGMSLRFDRTPVFRPDLVEPGVKTVLGRRYGGPGQHGMEAILAVLHDLAVHPVTARHMARKLAVHFVSDAPDPLLEAAMADRWMRSGGDLLSVYDAMLRHPAAWSSKPGNVKPPFDFVASACRALDLPRSALSDLAARAQLLLEAPLRLMGQDWQKPAGPDGLAEADSAWITPQGMAARMQWTFTFPQALLRNLPDPRDFVETALGPRAPREVRFAAAAAETRSDGIGVVLASPAFQRM